jgi:hypothetical protein
LLDAPPRTDRALPTAVVESDVRAPGAIPPLVTYERTGKPDDPMCAVTGGYVVRDPGLKALGAATSTATSVRGRS